LKKKVEKKERVFLGNNKYTPGMGKPWKIPMSWDK
jgi:hypothetical protein